MIPLSTWIPTLQQSGGCYVTADDGASEELRDTPKADLKNSGLSTDILDRDQSSIISKFIEILKTDVQSPELTSTSNWESIAEDDEVDEDLEDFDDNLHSSDSLHLAAKSGRLENVVKAVKTFRDLNQLDQQRNTPLHIGYARGHMAVVEFLLKEGCDPNIQGPQGRTVILQALYNGYNAVIKYLLDDCSNEQLVNNRVDRFGTALHYATDISNEDSMVILLNAGADPNRQDGFKETPLHLSAFKRDLNMVKRLLDADIDMNAEDFWGDMAFKKELTTPINAIHKDGVIPIFLEHGAMLLQARGEDLRVELDSAEQFLAIEECL